MQNQTLSDCELCWPRGAASLECESTTGCRCSGKNLELCWFLTLMTTGDGQMKFMLKGSELTLICPFLSKKKKANQCSVLPVKRN